MLFILSSWWYLKVVFTVIFVHFINKIIETHNDDNLLTKDSTAHESLKIDTPSLYTAGAGHASFTI